LLTKKACFGINYVKELEKLLMIFSQNSQKFQVLKNCYLDEMGLVFVIIIFLVILNFTHAFEQILEDRLFE